MKDKLEILINKWRMEDNLFRVAWHHGILHQESFIAKSLKTPYVIKSGRLTETVN